MNVGKEAILYYRACGVRETQGLILVTISTWVLSPFAY
jgi:hypothetical protein